MQLHLENSAPEHAKVSWIAARFDNHLPPEFQLGDGSNPGTGDYYNNPLEKGTLFRVFVRAYTIGNVSVAGVVS